MPATAPHSEPLPTPQPAKGHTSFHGLYPTADFVVGEGARVEGSTTRHARWYFAQETVAVPKPGLPVPSVTRGASALADLHAWLGRPRPPGFDSYPPLVWVAAPHMVPQARIDAGATRLLAAEGAWKLALAPRLPLNHSYWNESSAAWFSARPLRVRGTLSGDTMRVRTLWPKD